ncbi:hypothetical protein PM022_12530 [Halorubrum ezzemoulense]|uniref:DUF7282 domain-containing protein n=1 Tax=Halorubrum ezzemoulense TaxID=337243 RepID=UPI00232E9113|nr:hypothetical protein [Halorubrum ezzemoulense]MDB2275355.1 hypothetical protein [Halorubrum ezzemoulense]
MTGGQKSTREKFGAVFFAFVMVTSMMAVGMAGFAGSAAALNADNVAVAQDPVVLGGADEPLGSSSPDAFSITEASDNEFGASGTAAVTLPDGVEFNQSSSNLQFRQVSSGSVSNVQFSDSQTLEFDYSGFDSGQADSIVFSRLNISVATDVGSDFDVDVRVGATSTTKTIDTASPSLTVDGTNSDAPTGNDQQVGAAATSDAFSVDVATAANGDGQIGAGTNVVIFANESNGITFDTSLNASSAASDLTYSSGAAGNLDAVNASFSSSGDRLTIPVTNEFTAGESVIVEGLQVNATADASDSQLTAETTPANSVGSVSAISATGRIDVVKPTASVPADNVVVGANQQELSGDLSVSSSSAGDIGAGTNVTFYLNNSAVTFDESQTLSATTADGSGDTGDPGVANTYVFSDRIVVELNTNGDGFEATDSVDVPTPQVNVSMTPADETPVAVNVDTKSSSSAATITSTATNTLTLERPNLGFNDGNNATVDVDNDGVNNVEISGAGQNALVVTNDDVGGQIGPGTNVTLSLESDTGVEFDTSVGTDTALSDDTSTGAATQDVSGTSDPGVANTYVFSDRVVVELNSNGDGFEAGDTITIDELFVNATADATNTTLAVTTNTSDSEVTTDLSNQIVVNELSPSQIAGDGNVTENNDLPTTFGNDVDVSDADSPDVSETVTGGVSVEDGSSAFGGADVNLEIVSTPEGSSGASLNASTVTTGSNGQAFYNFTAGDTTGDYVVNASLEGVSGGINITYDAQAGDVAGVNVVPIEDAIAGDSSEVGTASLYVNATDEFGNPVSTAGETVTITADNVGASSVQFGDDVATDGTAGSSSAINNDGTFTLASDGSSVIEVDSDQVEDVTITAEISGQTDTGTVTFFDEVGSVSVELNDTEVFPGDTVSANATIAESDGTTITVPDVTVSVSESSTPNASINDNSPTTNGDGVATTTVTADSAGDANIRASNNLRSDTQTLTIQERPGVTVTNVNLDPSTVTSNTTNDHTLTFDAEQVTDDGNTDTFTVTFPDNTLNSANNVNVTDADGEDISITSSPEVIDNGNAVTLSVSPDSNANYRTLTVEANVTVDAPDVSETTEANITIDAVDSNNGQDSVNTTLTVEPAGAQPTATVTFNDQTVTNGSDTVTVASANLSEGGFVAIHSVPVNPENGTPVDTVVGVSEYLGNGTSEDITVTLDEPVTANTTLVAMPHQDTNGNETYDFVTSEGSADGPYIEDGSAVVDSASITVSENPLTEYANENGVVGATGLQDAAADFRNGEVDSDILLDAAAAFRSGDPIE